MVFENHLIYLSSTCVAGCRSSKEVATTSTFDPQEVIHLSKAVAEEVSPRADEVAEPGPSRPPEPPRGDL